jgi:hypothetical protein
MFLLFIFEAKKETERKKNEEYEKNELRANKNDCISSKLCALYRYAVRNRVSQ